MAVSAWRRFAASGPARVLPVVGPGEPATAAAGGDPSDLLDALEVHPGIERVATPRHATLLLLAGRLPERLHGPLQRLHDQLPHPRVAVRFGAPLVAFPQALPRVPDERTGPRELGDALVEIARDTVRGCLPSSSPLLPDEPPTPWRGRGSHGQGGEGMMGGTPYGRPMAMTAPDLRDGLALDCMPLCLGPCFPGLPLGLTLRLALQGDVIGSASFETPPLALSPDGVFERALHEPVMLADLERARAAHHLRHLAELLRLRGAGALAVRARRVAAAPTAAGLARLCTALRRSQALRSIPPGLGRLDPAEALRWGGPTARAAGSDRDARADSSVYRELGFAPITQSHGDLRARLRQRMREAEQAIALSARAEGCAARIGPVPCVEGPEGLLSATANGGDAPAVDPQQEATAAQLSGLEWGDALLFLASLPLAHAPHPAASGAAPRTSRTDAPQSHAPEGAS